MSDNKGLHSSEPSPAQIASSAVSMSPSALKRVWHLIQEQGNYDLKLRVYITGGGCSGFQYGFTFTTEVAEDDSLFQKRMKFENGTEELISWVVDPLSLPYLDGAEIDYVETLQGAHFKVNNPNAETTCGCGSSFSI